MVNCAKTQPNVTPLSVVFAYLLLSTFGCTLVQTRVADNRSASQPSLVVSDSIFIDRIGSGDSARVQFKTASDALCKLSVFAQDPSRLPNASNPTVTRCSNPDMPRQAFSETITGLRQDTLYYVTIFTWQPNQKEGAATVLRVRESADTPSMINGDPKTMLNSFFVAKLDVPLMAAEVYKHKPSAAVPAAIVKNLVMQPVGCQQGLPVTQSSLSNADPEPQLENLATRDFAAGNARKHSEHPERLQVSYSSVNAGMNRWTLLYQNNGSDLEIPVQPINQLLSLEMESSTIHSFDHPQLLNPTEPIGIDPKKPLKFSWTIANTLLDPAYLIVQIGNLQGSDSVYCVFNANTGSAIIESDMLQKLDDGPQDLQARLVTNQLKVKEGWLITITDWRAGRITK